MTGVRWREDTGFEGRCDRCKQYWPLDPEFWKLGHGLRRCRACKLEVRAIHERAKYKATNGAAYKTPEYLAKRRERERQYKATARQDPEKRPHILKREREAMRRYYERHRAEVLERHRLAYQEKVGHEPTPGIGRPRIAA